MGLKPVIYEAGRLGWPAAVGAVRGCGRGHRRAGRDALPDLVHRVLPLSRPGRAGDQGVSQSAGACQPQHGDRSRGPLDLRRGPAGSAAPVPRGRRRLARGARGGGELHRRPGRDPGARRQAAEGALGPAGADLGRPELLRFRRHQPRLLQPLLPPPRGVRAGRLRHRRLGHGLSQLDAGDPARRRHQPGRGPAAGGGRRRADAAPVVAACARAHGALAAGNHAGAAARRGAAAGRDPDRADRRRRLPAHGSLGRRARVSGGPGDLPVLAAHGQDRHRRKPVLASAVDGAGPHPLHAVLQDLRHGRPAVLDRPRPGIGPLPA